MYDISRICEGLAHPIRERIYEILLKKREAKASELFEALKDEFKLSSRQSIHNHLVIMERAGIVELSKQRRELVVKLKMKVDISTTPIEEALT